MNYPFKRGCPINKTALFFAKYRMNQFINTRLFNLFKESTTREVSITEWELSYVAFAGELFAVSAKSERIVLHNSLCFVKAKLAFWQTQLGLGKKYGSPAVC